MNQAVKTEQIDAADKKKSQVKAQREFFVISKAKWEYLFEITASINEMASYLVLACGTGADHKTTSWSAGAIYQYAGISPKAATKAIMRLELCNAIEVKKAAQKNKFPIYKIRFNENPKKDPNGDNIYIPSGVVKGRSGEDSPLKRLVNYQNMELLYLFIRLYAFQDKSFDCISPDLISSVLKDPKGVSLDAEYDESGLLGLHSFMSRHLEHQMKQKTPFHNFIRYGVQNIYEDPFYYEYMDSEGEHQEKWGVGGFICHLNKLGLIQPTYFICRGDYSEADAMDVICEADKPQQINFIQAIADLHTKKTNLHTKKTRGGFIYSMDYVKGPDNVFTFAVLPSKYKKVHAHKVYKMTYRTPHGASKYFYANQFKYINEVKGLLAKVNQTYET